MTVEWSVHSCTIFKKLGGHRLFFLSHFVGSLTAHLTAQASEIAKLLTTFPCHPLRASAGIIARASCSCPSSLHCVLHTAARGILLKTGWILSFLCSQLQCFFSTVGAPDFLLIFHLTDLVLAKLVSLLFFDTLGKVVLQDLCPCLEDSPFSYQ